MYLNLVKCGFILMAFAVLVLSLLVNFFEPRLPGAIVQTFRYGKFSYVSNRKSFVDHLEVPKSWFRHFYFVATVYSFVISYLFINAYVYHNPTPELVSWLLDLVATPERTATVSATSVCLATALFCLQIWRRLYETFSVSVFSDCKINVVQYFIGIAHYVGAATALLMEAPGFANPSFKSKITPSLSDLGLREVAAVAIFMWAWYNQYQTALILANLRKNKSGTVVSYNYKLPVGGLFDRLSSPHMFCEMLMYLALNLIVWGHTTWPYIFFWVFCNQCETALLSHWWYKATFKTYPKNRKAYLPFIL